MTIHTFYPTLAAATALTSNTPSIFGIGTSGCPPGDELSTGLISVTIVAHRTLEAR